MSADFYAWPFRQLLSFPLKPAITDYPHPATAVASHRPSRDSFQRLHFGLQQSSANITPYLGLHRDPKTNYQKYLQENRKVPPDLAYNADRPAKAQIIKVVKHLQDDGKVYAVEVTLNIKHTNFKDPRTAQLRLLPGQHVGIILPASKGVDTQDGRDPDLKKVRWYSIASPRNGEDGHGNLLRLIIRTVQPGKKTGKANSLVSYYMSKLQPGQKISLIGPVTNRFLGPDDPKTPIVCLGVGTSVSPYIAMFRERFEVQPCPDQYGDAFLGVGHTRPALAYDNECLSGFAANKDHHFTYKTAYSKTQSKHITDLVRDNAKQIIRILEQPNARLYISGFKNIDKDLKKTLVESAPQSGKEPSEVEGLLEKLENEQRLHVESSSVEAAYRAENTA